MMLAYANLALRFLLELCTLASVGYWGFQMKQGMAVKIVLGIGAPLLVAVVWATFGSPQASLPLTGWLHFALELVVFGSGAAALYAAGRPGLAAAFALAVVINRSLMYVWGQ